MSHVIKRNNITQPYEREKLHSSIKAVSLSVNGYIGSAEVTAHKVCDHIEEWLKAHGEVTSRDIRSKASEILANYDIHASNLYKTHMEIG